MADTNLRREDEIDERYDGMFNNHPDLVGMEKDATNREFESIAAKNADLDNRADKNAGINQVGSSERNSSIPFTNTTPRKTIGERMTGLLKKKKSAAIGGAASLGIVGAIIATMFGPFTLLHNLQANFADTNDARSGIMERRLVKLLEKKFSKGRGGPCDVKAAKCRMGKVSNRMLSRMANENITPYDGDKKFDIKSDTGYPDNNPTHFEIDDGKGGKKMIPASDFVAEYKTNPRFRGNFKGAYGMRYFSQRGKFLAGKFFNKLGLKRDGGITSESSGVTEDNIKEKVDEKLKSPDDTESKTSKQSIIERIKKIITRSTERIKKSKGDAIIALGTGMCLVENTPRMIGGIIRGYQLLQVLAIFQDIVNSPAGMAKSGDIKPEKMAAVGKKLTETYKNDSGDAKSALDSPILLSAMGVNSGKPTISKYTPGYAFFSNPIVKQSTKASAKTKDACNKITSPEAQLTAEVIETGIGASTAGIGYAVTKAIKGLGKGLIAIGAVDVVMEQTMFLAETMGMFDLMANLMKSFMDSTLGNYLDGAKGEQLGDIIGTGAFAYYSQMGLAGGAGVLSKKQIASFDQVMASAQEERRQEAVATLNPFDISSKYTFAGSVVSSLSTNSMTYSNPVASTLGMLRLPFASPIASADSATTRCSYGSEFDVEDVGINISGYPCVGIPSEYLDDSVDNVLGRVGDEIDPDTGDPLPGSDIALMMDECSDGDLESVSGCTIHDKDRAAQSLYMHDKVLNDTLDGSDDEEAGSDSSGAATSPASDGTVGWPLDKKYWLSDKADFLNSHTTTGSAWGDGVSSELGISGNKGAGIAADVGVPVGTKVYAMMSGTVASTNLCGSKDGIAVISELNGKKIGIAYMHGNNQKFKVGDQVSVGDYIMDSGAVGCNVYGPHLHIGIVYGGNYICPQDVFLSLGSGQQPDFEALVSKGKAPCGGRG